MAKCSWIYRTSGLDECCWEQQLTEKESLVIITYNMWRGCWMIGKLENKSTQSMQCDLLRKDMPTSDSKARRGKKTLSGQSPLSWGCKSTDSCAKEEIPGSQLMPSFQPKCLLFGWNCPFHANQLQLPIPTLRKKEIFHTFPVIVLLVLEKGLTPLFPLKMFLSAYQEQIYFCL